MNAARHHWTALCAAAALVGTGLLPAVGQIQYPPTLGVQNGENDVRGIFTEVFSEDFEGPLHPDYLIGPNFTVTTDPTEVLEGKKSLRLDGADAAIQIPASVLQLDGEETYLVEFRYRLINPAADGNAFVVALTWPEFPIESPGAAGGAFNAIIPEEGVFHYALRIADTTEALLTIANLDPAMILDELRIFRLDVQSWPAVPTPLSCGFPRLSNFHVYSTTFSSLANEGTTEEFINHMGLHDLVNGLPLAHTRGSDLEFLSLRAINPDIIILPYVQAYMAVIGPTAPIGGSADVLGFFNQGLEEDWYMRKPNGEKLPEILYPEIFQMNHTSFGKSVNGVTFVDYMAHFLTRSVLGAGVWDGLHFDQSEWRTNTLLSDPDPFGGGGTYEPVEIDLDEDGVAESEEELVLAWRAAYYSYFDRMRAELGPSKILFGNPGAPPLDPTLLSRVNGFQFEYFNAFRIDASGGYITDNGSAWHRYLDQLHRCAEHMQAPQVFSTQFSGQGLGTPSGTTTGNGVANREPVLVAEDFRRMRLGLTTTLLGNGFFGYDFVDNTTKPTVWFDEYAVNAQGVASKSLDAKGYLGQPLDDATELAYPRVDLYELDFEPGSPAPPPEFYINYDVLSTTSDPELVISGTQSATGTYVRPEGELGAFLVSTVPSLAPLEVGEVYEIVVDYRISGYLSTSGDALTVGITDYDPENDNLPYQVTSLTAYDFRDELQGTLRAVATVENTNASANVLVRDDLTITIDNVRISKATGGVFRRDFENGVVLVNPSPVAQTLSLSQISGPLGRTGLRRISGTQDPAWNDGQPVTGDLTLPSGDGIILLADHLAPVDPAVPSNVQVDGITDTTAEVRFDYAGRPPAGFKVSYGLVGGHRTSHLLDGLDQHVHLVGLVPGATYEVGICAFDFAGEIFAESPLATFSTTGTVPATRPELGATPTLVPGSEMALSGTNLAAGSSSVPSGDPLPDSLGGVQVFLNGLPCPLRAVGPGEVTIAVPATLPGPLAVLRVERDGVTGPSYHLPVFQAGIGQVETLGIFPLPDGSAELRWRSSPGQTYWIEDSTDGCKTWQPFRKAVAGYGTTEMRIVVPENLQHQFFRIMRY